MQDLLVVSLRFRYPCTLSRNSWVSISESFHRNRQTSVEKVVCQCIELSYRQLLLVNRTRIREGHYLGSTCTFCRYPAWGSCVMAHIHSRILAFSVKIIRTDAKVFWLGVNSCRVMGLISQLCISSNPSLSLRLSMLNWSGASGIRTIALSSPSEDSYGQIALRAWAALV